VRRESAPVHSNGGFDMEAGSQQEKKKAQEGGAEEVAGACHAFWRNTGSFLRFWDGFKETFHWESIQFGNWEMGFVETEDLRERKRELGALLWCK
jgi:hypothetical protein